MATLECPTQNTLPAFTYTLQLEGATYTLWFTYNDRMSRWMLSIGDSVGNILVGEVPGVVSMPMFDRYKEVEGLPPGTFYFFDTANTNTDPGRYDLGNRVRLFYQESTGP